MGELEDPDPLEAALLHLHHFAQWRLQKLYPNCAADLLVHTSGIDLPTLDLPGWQLSRLPSSAMNLADCAGPRRGPRLRLQWKQLSDTRFLTISGNAFPRRRKAGTHSEC